MKSMEPKYTLEEATISTMLATQHQFFVTFRLINKETGEIKTQEVFFGDFPIMTEMGTFIINGGERIIRFSVGPFTRCLL